MTLQTNFEFVLPRGYLDETGQLHQSGCMRLATALDEIEALENPLVQTNEAYLPVVLLSRVVTRLGNLPIVTPSVMAGLFASDMVYLEDLYLRVNSAEAVTVAVVCPHCSAALQIQVAPLDG
jgi:hypothetical protein